MTTTSNNQPTSTPQQMPLHRKYKRTDTPKAEPPNLEQQVLAITSTPVSDAEKLTGLLRLAITSSGGIGGFFASRMEEKWFLAEQRPKLGKIPGPAFFDETFNEKCDSFAASPTIKTWTCESLDDLLLFAIPLSRDENAEVMLILAPPKTQVVQATHLLARFASALHLWLTASGVKEANWQVESLASIIDITSQIETQPTSNCRL